MNTMITKLNLTIVNVYLVKGPKLVVVDTGAPGSAPKILAALAKQGFAPADVSLILLTHAHSDHAGSAGELRKATGAPVAVHRGDLDMLRRGDNGRVFPTDFEARLSQRFVDRPFPALEPDILLDDQSDLRELNSCSVETEGFEAKLGIRNSWFLQNMSLEWPAPVE